MGHASDVFSSAPGDLLLTVKVKPHEFFTSKDCDIWSEVPITLLEAIRGTEMTV